ncbi:arginase [Ascodesmis nigricans]|uniref:Arginase n=1 Tax=Ascodesmis nigricans TaxID=341454 RepID=A0A4S2N3C3_9PEZI|nr:arginase [Ascodesmis nigricans]
MTSTPSNYLPDPKQLGVVAVGFSLGQGKLGVDAAPKALIEAGLLTQLSDDLEFTLHHDGIHDYSPVIPSSDPPLHVAGGKAPMLNPRTVSNVTREISNQVYSHASAGRLVLTLGGDHSIAVGTVSGIHKAVTERTGQEPYVIWVDAHADINTPIVSGSGNIHGMPLAFLTNLCSAPVEDPEVFGWLEESHKIDPKKLVYIGLRDVDKAEKKILRENGIKAFSMHDVDRWGIGRVMDMVMEYVGSAPIHLSFDVDALDPLWAPSTGTPVRGGLTLREGDFICECVHASGNLVAMDLVEVNPHIEGEAPIVQGLGAQETVRAGCSLVRCALGESLL